MRAKPCAASPTPEGRALGNRIIRKVIIWSIATFVVVGIMLALYFSM